jgi:hypothetical protein
MCKYYSRHREPSRIKITLDESDPQLPNMRAPDRPAAWRRHQQGSAHRR